MPPFPTRPRDAKGPQAAPPARVHRIDQFKTLPRVFLRCLVILSLAMWAYGTWGADEPARSRYAYAVFALICMAAATLRAPVFYDALRGVVVQRVSVIGPLRWTSTIALTDTAYLFIRSMKGEHSDALWTIELRDGKRRILVGASKEAAKIEALARALSSLMGVRLGGRPLREILASLDGRSSH